MDEGLEVGELIESVVIRICIEDLLGIVEDLHAEDAEDEVDEGEQMEEFDDYWHDLHESCEDSLYVVEDRWGVVRHDGCEKDDANKPS